jgi:hypothetical protein
MSDQISRRDVLRGIGGFAFASALGCDAPSDIEVATSAIGTCAATVIPAVPNRAVTVSGVEGWAEKSVAAGGTVNFRISSPVSYTLEIVRLGWDLDAANGAAPNRDWVLKSFSKTPSPQTYRPGSYIHVERALSPSQAYSAMTLECWVRPFRYEAGGAWQGVISQYNVAGQAGFGLFLDSDNRPCMYFGNGGNYNPAWLCISPTALVGDGNRQWHHLAAVFSAGTASLYVNGVNVFGGAVTGMPAQVLPGGAPFRIGAYGDQYGTGNFLDGDIAMPAIYSRALTPAQIQTRATTKPPTAVPTSDTGIIGCWPLTEEQGDVVADVSGCARPGLIVNRGTWMVGGPGFNAAGVPRLGPYNPQTDPTRGHGLRLSSASIYDCAAWPVNTTYTFPDDSRPGLYAGRVKYGSGQVYDITIVVRRSPTRPPAPIVVLCATNTWLAYNISLGGYSFYGGKQPPYLLGINMPWTNAAEPYQRYYDPAYSHLVRAERFMHSWLERNGYDYDLISDKDLHDDPSLLNQYKALVIAGHSEYWSVDAKNAVGNFLNAGKGVVVASGNTMFWRVTYSPDGSVIECRKKPSTVGGFDEAQWGELYHQHDKARGGLMREAGSPAWQTIGLECVGYGPSSQYKVTAPSHPLYHFPEDIPVAVDTPLGGPQDVFHEWDVRPPMIPGSLTPAMPPDYAPELLAQAWVTTDQRFDYQANRLPEHNGVISEIIYWVKPSGGRLFNAGSIAASRGLHNDNKLAALFRNALHWDGVVVRATALTIGTDGVMRQRRREGFDWQPAAAGDDLGGTTFHTNPPVGVQWAPNSLAAMAINQSGVFKYNYNVGTGWAGWADFTGGTFVGRPAAVGWGRNRLNLFARTTGNRLLEKAWDGTTWTGWTDAGDSAIVSDPTAVSFQGTRLVVAARTSAGSIHVRTKTDGVWSFTNLGGTFAYPPTLHAFGGNRMVIFAVQSNGRCLAKVFNGNVWDASWTDLVGSFTGRMQVGQLARDNFVVYGIGADGGIKLKQFDNGSWLPSPGGAWNASLGGTFAGELSAISYRGSSITLMAVDTAGALKQATYDGNAWGPWSTLATGQRVSPMVFSWVSSA